MFIIHFLINSNIWVAVCALALALSSEILLQTSSFSVSYFVFFATLGTYNFQRFVRIKKGSNHARKSWLKKNRIAVYFLIFFAFVISTHQFFKFKFTTQIIIFSVAILSFFYPFGLRKIPFVKIFIISFVWSISTMLFLVFENEIVITQNVVLHLLSRFLFVFSITIPFDIRDLKYDLGKIKTIPLFFGQRKAKWFAKIAILICFLIAAFQQAQNTISFSNFLALSLLYFLTLLMVIKSDKNNSEVYFSFWLESLGVFSYLFLVIMLLIF